MLRRRAGFTLVEVMVGLVILGLVVALLYRSVISSQRVSQAQVERAAMQANIRAAAFIVPAELYEVAAGPGSTTDILAMSPTAITYRAMRGLGVICQVAGNEVRVQRDQGRWFALRQPQAGRDSVLLFVDGDPGTDTDDAWIPLRITSVNMSSRCGALPAIALGATVPNPAAVTLGSPARTFEVMELSLYTSAGDRALGLRSVSGGGSTQPILGPLAANGFRLVYRDASGNPTTVRSAVRSIEVQVRGVTARPIAGGAGLSGARQVMGDSLTTFLLLRNGAWP
ncbi:MAG: PilW family protein [Gemmatimonadota bacterium]